MTRQRRPHPIIAQLDAETRYRYDQAVMEGAALHGELGVESYLIAHDLLAVPAPLDCADLAATFRRSKLEAVAALGMLSRPQLVRQAWAYAAYLSELRGEPVVAENVLANWERGLAARLASVADDYEPIPADAALPFFPTPDEIAREQRLAAIYTEADNWYMAA